MSLSGFQAKKSYGSSVKRLLFGLGATDPVAIVITTDSLAVTATFAGFLPAGRASLVDSMVKLRYE